MLTSRLSELGVGFLVIFSDIPRFLNAQTSGLLETHACVGPATGRGKKRCVKLGQFRIELLLPSHKLIFAFY